MVFYFSKPKNEIFWPLIPKNTFCPYSIVFFTKKTIICKCVCYCYAQLIALPTTTILLKNKMCSNHYFSAYIITIWWKNLLFRRVKKETKTKQNEAQINKKWHIQTHITILHHQKHNYIIVPFTIITEIYFPLKTINAINLSTKLVTKLFNFTLLLIRLDYFTLEAKS